jgi:hypothetical protein
MLNKLSTLANCLETIFGERRRSSLIFSTSALIWSQAAMWRPTIAPVSSISSFKAELLARIGQRNVYVARPHVNRRNTLQEHWYWGRDSIQCEITDYSRRKPMKQPTIKTASSPLTRPRILMLGSLLGLATVAALLATQAQAQTTEPAAGASAPAAAATASAPVVLKYDPKDLERAFKFMDKTGDGKVSRDEASNFRGVSKHFDEADLNKDGFLSREEFDNAMNRSRQP